jgi:ubiquinone/menaquinone biosynthesis C-methylase UbiE
MLGGGTADAATQQVAICRSPWGERLPVAVPGPGGVRRAAWLRPDCDGDAYGPAATSIKGDVVAERAYTADWPIKDSGPEAYERYLVPAIFAPWGERLVERARIGRGERVLDLACGTGIVARLAAACVGPGGAVTGVDINPEMIAVAHAVTSGGGPPIEWRESDAHALPFADGSFDAGLCQFSLMFFSDRHAALLELRRVIAPGGRVAMAVWRSTAANPGWSLFATALEQHVSPAAAATMRAPFVFADAEEIYTLVKGAGFHDVRMDVDTRTTRFPSAREMILRQAAASPLAGPIGALDAPALDRFVAGLADLLEPYTHDDGVSFPSEAYIVTARR